MLEHHTTDYKISTLLLQNDTSYTNVCNIFNCNERSLKHWINRFQNNISRIDRESKVYKNHVDFIINELRKNKQITMTELLKNYSNIITP